MNAHPKNKQERRKVDTEKKRREAFLKEALKRQEAEDALKADSEHVQREPGRMLNTLIGEQTEGIETLIPF